MDPRESVCVNICVGVLTLADLLCRHQFPPQTRRQLQKRLLEILTFVPAFWKRVVFQNPFEFLVLGVSGCAFFNTLIFGPTFIIVWEKRRFLLQTFVYWLVLLVFDVLYYHSIKRFNRQKAWRQGKCDHCCKSYIYELLHYIVVFIGQQLFIETCLQSKAVCGSLTEPVDQPPGIWTMHN